jgi:hypothetical protein
MKNYVDSEIWRELNKLFVIRDMTDDALSFGLYEAHINKNNECIFKITDTCTSTNINNATPIVSGHIDKIGRLKASYKIPVINDCNELIRFIEALKRIYTYAANNLKNFNKNTAGYPV